MMSSSAEQYRKCTYMVQNTSSRQNGKNGKNGKKWNMEKNRNVQHQGHLEFSIRASADECGLVSAVYHGQVFVRKP